VKKDINIFQKINKNLADPKLLNSRVQTSVYTTAYNIFHSTIFLLPKRTAQALLLIDKSGGHLILVLINI